MERKMLDLYAFWWSEARLVIAAGALFLGGIPPALYFLGSFPLVGPLLNLSWVLSGLVSAYLLYRWYESKWFLFGRDLPRERAAFAVNIVTGFNLGLVPIIGRNIGMSVSSNYILFVIVGLLYLATAVYLFRIWSTHGQTLFP
jgi:hypothetical protein